MINVGVLVGPVGDGVIDGVTVGVGVFVAVGVFVGVGSFRSTTGRYALGTTGNGVSDGSGVSDGVGVSIGGVGDGLVGEGGCVGGRVIEGGCVDVVLGRRGTGVGVDVCVLGVGVGSGVEAARIANTATSNRGTTYRSILAPLRFAGRTT